jgi:hypothetical protein
VDLEIADAGSPAGWGRLERRLGAAALAKHLARPRSQQGFAIVAGPEGAAGHLLLAHERRRLGAASLNIGQVMALELDDPGDDALRAGLLAAAADAASAAGLMWLRLYGQAAHYRRFGMAAASLQHTLLLPSPPGGAVGGLRPATPADSDDLAALRASDGAAGATDPLRAAAEWRALIAEANLLVYDDRLGRAVGYVLVADGLVIEAAAADAGVARELLAALGARSSNLQLDLPLGQRVARAAILLGAAARVWAPPDDAPTWLWGVVDLAGALGELRPELIRRLAGSRYAGWAGALSLEGATSAASLRAGGGELWVEAAAGPPDVRLHRMSLGGMAQLLLGYRAAADLRATGELSCADSDLGLIDSLFPALL